MAAVTIVHALVVIIVTAVLEYVAPDRLDIWAPILGMMGAALAAVQYIPQIWTTYHLKHVGSLSIPMMCIQTPGGFLFAASLMARLGWGGWSSWGIFLLTATMQGILLALAIYYEVQARKDSTDNLYANGRPGTTRTTSSSNSYDNGYDNDRPGTYSSHPEIYAADPTNGDQVADIIDRQQADADADMTPLISTLHRDREYGTNRG